MKNINYDLNKILHLKMKMAWFLEKHAIPDGEKCGCHSVKVLQKMLKQEESDIAAVKKDIYM